MRFSGRGFSLLEVLVAFVVILLVSLYTMSMFASGQQHYLRAQEFSQATRLVQAQLDSLLTTPLDEIQPGTQNLTVGSATYRRTVRLAPCTYSAPLTCDLTEIDVDVRSPRGALATASTFKGGEITPGNPAVDPFTNELAFRDGSQLRYWNENTVSATIVSGSATGGSVNGTLAGSPGSGLVWLADPSLGLFKWLETGSWKAASVLPAATVPERLSGLAATPEGSTVFAGDSSNRGLWVYRETPTGSWSSLYRPTRAPLLGAPSALACDPYGSVVWVADSENQCLRKLLLDGSTPSPYGATAQPIGPAGEYWLAVQYRPPSLIRMGVPRSICMDPFTNDLYVLDGGRLYKFVDEPVPAPVNSAVLPDGPGTWTVVGVLSDAVLAAQPCGLVGDFCNNVLYLHCRGPVGQAPQLYKVTPLGGQTSRFDRLF